MKGTGVSVATMLYDATGYTPSQIAPKAVCGPAEPGYASCDSDVLVTKRSDQRVELTSRDQCLVSPAEHAIGLTRRRCQDKRRDREVSCLGCARDPLLARWVGAHLDPSSPGSHTPIVRHLYGAYKYRPDIT